MDIDIKKSNVGTWTHMVFRGHRALFDLSYVISHPLCLEVQCFNWYEEAKTQNIKYREFAAPLAFLPIILPEMPCKSY